jgi:hypothetical protein
MASLESRLRDNADGLAVVYDDIHGLHGGTSIALAPNRQVVRKTVDRVADPVVTQYTATAEQVAAPIELLIEIRAWEQQVPDVAPVAGESRATLSITVGDERGGFWERYNDMSKLGRLSRVKAALEAIAPG